MLFLERSLVILSQSAVVGVHVHGTDGYAQEKHRHRKHGQFSCIIASL